MCLEWVIRLRGDSLLQPKRVSTIASKIGNDFSVSYSKGDELPVDKYHEADSSVPVYLQLKSLLSQPELMVASQTLRILVSHKLWIEAFEFSRKVCYRSIGAHMLR